MEQQEAPIVVTTKSAGIRYGLISAVIGIIYFIILRAMNVDMQGPAGWLNWVILGVLIFLAQKYYKDNGDGYLEYSQGIGIAFWLGLTSAAISSVFTYIYIKFVDTAFVDQIRDKQYEEMQARGMSDEQIDQAMKIAGMFSTPEAILIMGFIFSIIGAVIIALLVTLITQKKRPETSGALDG
jgi:uncharacterized membrane protein YeaQ/YmgE (transglycosylase-associated protein family)